MMKKYVVAIDSMKGCLTSEEASRAFAAGIRVSDPEAYVLVIPVADGGEGTAEVLAKGCGLKTCIISRVTGPAGNEVDAQWWYDDTSSTAFIDMAQSSGLTLVKECDRNPLHTTGYGFGQLISEALDIGAVRIIAGLGGSATVDGGVGACQALGVKFLDAGGVPVLPHACGRQLMTIRDIDISGLDPRLHDIDLQLVCDVTNPLTGVRGAARVFGPQKGASEEDVVLLEAGLENFRNLVIRKFGTDLDEIQGSGAAGGCGGGLSALAGGRIVDGTSFVLDLLGLDRLIADADAVVTGEGSADAQTLMGKLPSGILRCGKAAGVQVALVAGILKDERNLASAGFSPLICINDSWIIADSGTLGQSPMDPHTAILRLKSAGVRFGAGIR